MERLFCLDNIGWSDVTLELLKSVLNVQVLDFKGKQGLMKKFSFSSVCHDAHFLNSEKGPITNNVTFCLCNMFFLSLLCKG